MKQPRRPVDTSEQRRAAFLARHPRLAANVARATAAPASDIIALGTDDSKRLITLDDKPRLEHMHAIGATGCGKSTFLLNCILQDIARGRGVCVLDPHGGHPDSLMNMVLRFLHDHNWFAGRKVHIIAPNVREHVVGLNPLAPLPNTEHAVIAGAMLKAFERVWGDEDTHEKPTTRRLLRTIFMALTETRMTIADAVNLLDYEDADGFRLKVIEGLEDDIVKSNIERIEKLSRQPRGFQEFENTVLGPMNRLAEFIACPAIRAMLGTSREEGGDSTIDLLNIIDRGEILLVDLQHGTSVDEAATDLLGKILLRYFFMLMTHRKPYKLDGQDPKFHPFFVYVDECHRFMTDDIESLLVQARKFGIGVALAHQYLAQLGKPGDKIYEAVRNSTQVKAVFRINSGDEAETLARDVIRFDLEMPVAASIRPVVVGHKIGRLNNETYSVGESEGESAAVTASRAISSGITEMQNWARIHSRSRSKSGGSATGSSEARGSAHGLNTVENFTENMNYGYDPNTGMFFGTPATSLNIGASQGSAVADFASDSFQRAENASKFESATDSESVADAEGGGLARTNAVSESQAQSRGTNKQRNKSQAAGSNETIIPVYEDRPTAFHPINNVQYMAAETLRELPTGRAVLRFRGNTTFLNVPPPRRSKKP